jgi:hypothetical protein
VATGVRATTSTDSVMSLSVSLFSIMFSFVVSNVS